MPRTASGSRGDPRGVAAAGSVKAGAPDLRARHPVGGQQDHAGAIGQPGRDAGRPRPVTQPLAVTVAHTWAMLGSNQRPLPCEGSALPLSQSPGSAASSGRRRSVPRVAHRRIAGGQPRCVPARPGLGGRQHAHAQVLPPRRGSGTSGGQDARGAERRRSGRPTVKIPHVIFRQARFARRWANAPDENSANTDDYESPGHRPARCGVRRPRSET